jgi:hypothetical protein
MVCSLKAVLCSSSSKLNLRLLKRKSYLLLSLYCIGPEVCLTKKDFCLVSPPLESAK